MRVGGAPGESESSLDLGSGEVVDHGTGQGVEIVGILDLVGVDRVDRGEQPGLIVGHHSGVGFHHLDPVEAGKSVAVDSVEGPSQVGARRHLCQSLGQSLPLHDRHRCSLSLEHVFETTGRLGQIPYPRQPISKISVSSIPYLAGMAAITLPSGVSAWTDLTSHINFGRNEWPYYDGIPDRDPYRILPDDVQVTVSMNSFVNNANAVRDVHRGLARYRDPILREIPVEADLMTFDPDLSIARRLYDAACTPRGVLLAVATKVLHRKRPRYIPMLDSVIIGAYVDAAGRPAFKGLAAESKEKAGTAGTFVMDLFRKDLLATSDQLEPIHRALTSKGAPMTPVRLLEVAVWMANEGNGYYRRDVTDPVVINLTCRPRLTKVTGRRRHLCGQYLSALSRIVHLPPGMSE